MVSKKGTSLSDFFKKLLCKNQKFTFLKCAFSEISEILIFFQFISFCEFLRVFASLEIFWKPFYHCGLWCECVKHNYFFACFIVTSFTKKILFILRVFASLETFWKLLETFGNLYDQL